MLTGAPSISSSVFFATHSGSNSSHVQGDLAGAVEKLLSLEKKLRLGGDAISTSRVALEILRLCWRAKDLKALNANILVIAKRRGQLKSVLVDVVREAMKYVDELGVKEDKVELITTLRTVSEGKVSCTQQYLAAQAASPLPRPHAHTSPFSHSLPWWLSQPASLTPPQIHVEVERARLTKQLAGIQEAEGRIAEASETLQEIAVETFGSMERGEKADFLLEQIRLTRAQRDFVKMGILANKVSRKQLEEAGMEATRLRFYGLMASLHQQQHDALALCKDHQAVLATRGYADDAAKWVPAMQSVVVYLALAPWSNEVSDTMHRLKADKRLEEAGLASHKALLELLTTHELVSWPLPAPHHEALLAHDAFTKEKPGPLGAGAAAAVGGAGAGAGGAGGMSVDDSGSAAAAASSTSSSAAAGGAGVVGRTGGGVATAIVRKEDEERAGWAAILHKRIVQHNVRVLAKWYARITTARLAALLGLDAATTEAAVSELAADKALYAKIDRPAGVVVFARPRPAEEVLSEWAADLDKVLSLTETTSHLIQREYLVRGITAGRA